MNCIIVATLPMREVIYDLARGFGTTVSEDCGHYELQLPEAWGIGYIKGTTFNGGLGMMEYACTFNEDLELHFTVPAVHPLKFLFCLEGEVTHRFAHADAEPHTLDQYQNAIVASVAKSGHVLHFLKGVYTDIHSLDIDKMKFQSAMCCELKSSSPSLQAVFNDVEGQHEFYYKGLYSLILALMFQEMKAFDQQGLIRKLFLEGKAFQILAGQLMQFEADALEQPEPSLLRKSEVKAVLQAIAIIENEIDYLGSVKTIAGRVGLTTNKMQDGFKSLYGQTVNEYIQQAKLEVAKNLLLKTNLSMQEILDEIGWTSKSYFSKIFRDHFNETPTDYRKNKGL